MVTSVFSQTNDQKVRVFLDCNRSWLCDFDYVRTEMKMVEFVRDRFQSDVHVLITTQFGTNGAEHNQMNFLGQLRFAGLNDTLSYSNDPIATDDDKRKQLVHYLQLGLMRYIAKTDIADKIEIKYTVNPDTTQKAETKKDPWNSWTFSFGLSGFVNKNQNYDSKNVNANFNSSKETESKLTSLFFSHSYNREIVSISDTEKVEINRDRTTLFFDNRRKLTDHFGVGLDGGFNSVLFDNLDIRVTTTPWFEYSLFPYSKFNSERIVFDYGLGVEYSNYRDTTIYFKTSEWHAKQTAAILTSFTKPWGSINVGCYWSNYLADFRKNNFSITGAVSWKVFKGFQFGLFGNYSFIRDQINLPKEDATRDDVLTRRRIIASDYDFNIGVGFSYHFGSIFNSAVHQTFKGLNYSVNF
jgi:hypothetical protein